MPNRSQSIPLPPLPEWNESAGFRQTLLFYFEPAQAAALGTLSEILHEHAMECGEWHKRPAAMLWYEVEAALGDILHVSGFLRHVAVEGGSDLSHEERKLAVIAAKVGKKLERLAARLRRGLDSAGDAGPGQPPPPPPVTPFPALPAAPVAS